MIKLVDLLKEFDFGKKLFADPSRAKHARYKLFMFKTYKFATEADTPEEAALWKQIQNYLKDDEKGELVNFDMKQLNQLKGRFPAILDPGLNANSSLYRGMTLEVDKIIKLIQDTTIPIHQHSRDWIRLGPLEYNITSRSKGFLSLSLDWNVASSFVGGAGLIGKTGRWPVVASTTYNKVDDIVFMNPNFLAAVGGFNEKETWLLGQTLPATELFIQSPWTTNHNSQLANTIAIALESRNITEFS